MTNKRPRISEPPKEPNEPKDHTQKLLETLLEKLALGSNDTILPHPDRYYGDASKFDLFWISVKGCFELAPKQFNSQRKKCVYVGTLLGGSALDWYQSIYDVDTIMNSIDLFKESMRAAFDDPDKRRQARNKLGNFVQGSRPVTKYAAEFARLARLSEIDETSKAFLYEKNLNENIRDELIHYDIPEKLADLINLTIKIDSRLSKQRRSPASRKQEPIGSATKKSFSGKSAPIGQPRKR